MGGHTENETGHFVYPTVFSGLKHDDVVMQEEIFGPVVGFATAKDFDQAIEYANATDYGLTGAVLTQNRHHIEQARRDFHVGTCTSTAAVQRQSSATSHSVDSRCPAQTPKRVDRTTWHSTCRARRAPSSSSRRCDQRSVRPLQHNTVYGVQFRTPYFKLKGC